TAHRLGDQVYHATEGVAAVLGRVGSLDHFDVREIEQRQGLEVDLGAIAAQDRMTVQHQQHATADAAGEPRRTTNVQLIGTVESDSGHINEGLIDRHDVPAAHLRL